MPRSGCLSDCTLDLNCWKCASSSASLHTHGASLDYPSCHQASFNGDIADSGLVLESSWPSCHSCIGVDEERLLKAVPRPVGSQVLEGVLLWAVGSQVVQSVVNVRELPTTSKRRAVSSLSES